jgi:hypothetical protein
MKILRKLTCIARKMVLRISFNLRQTSQSKKSIFKVFSSLDYFIRVLRVQYHLKMCKVKEL